MADEPSAMRARRWGVAVLATTALTAGLLVVPAAARAGSQTAGVQVALRALGLYLGPIDGLAGPQTGAAVAAAQRRAGLPVTGVPDARTRRSLGPLGRPAFGSRALARGDFGLDVVVTEYLLSRRGFYDGALDGFLGPEAERAVRRFQRSTGLAADGVVGPRTRSALTGTPAVPVDYRVPVSSAQVRDRLTAWAETLGVQPSLVRALAWMESGFQPGVVSSVGARGVLQTLPSTRVYVETVLVGKPLPRTLDGDIQVGVRYLRHLLDAFGGDTRLALAGWYEGERAVREHGVYDETKPFVADVLALSERM